MRYKRKRNPDKSIHFAGRNYDIEDGRYVLVPGYGGGYVPSEEPKRARSRTLTARPSLLDEGQQAAKEAQMNAYPSALSYVDKAHAAIRGAQRTLDPSYLEQARYALKAAKWHGATLQKSPYAEAHDRALVRRKISEAAKALQDEVLYMAKRMGAQQNPRRKKNPLTAGLGGTYIVTHANPRTPSTSVKLRFPSSSAAWAGMRALDDAGIDAGYPSLGPEPSGPHKGYYTVRVSRKNAAAAQRVLGGGARANPQALVWKRGAGGGLRADIGGNSAYLIGNAYSFGGKLKGYFSVSFWKGYSESGRRDVARMVKGLDAAKQAAQRDYDQMHA